MSERVDVLDIDLSDVREEAEKTGKTLKDLRKEVKDLRSQLENTEIGTEDFTQTLDELTRKQQELTNVTKSGVAAQKDSYNDLVNQMAILKKEWRATADESERAALGERIGDINSRLKEMDATLGNHQRNVGNYESALEGVNIQLGEQNSLFESSLGTIRGLMGTYQLIEGSIKAFGVDSEEATKAIQKMQGVMAITEGLKAIQDGVKGYKQLTAAINLSSLAAKGFSKALVTTGIGAIVVALGLLIANWEKVAKLWGGDVSVETLNGHLEDLNKTLDKTKDKFENEQEQAYSRYRQTLINARGDVDKLREAEAQLTKELEAGTRAKLKSTLADAWAAEARAYEDYLKIVNSPFKSAEKKREAAEVFTAIKQVRIDAQNEITKFEQETELKKIEAQQKAKEEEQKYYEQKKAQQEKYLDDLNKKLQSYGLKGIGDDAFIPNSEKLQTALADLKTFYDNRLITDEQYLMAKKELEERYSIDNGILTPEMIESAEQGFKDYKVTVKRNLDLEQKMRDEAAKIRTNKEKATWNNVNDIVSAGMSATTAFLEEGSAEQKAIQVAQTIMNTYTAAMQAATTTPTLWGKIAAISTMVATGLVQVKNILAVDPYGESSVNTVSATATPSMSALTSMSSGIQSTTVVEGASTESEITDTRVYVLESDISSTQKNVKATVDEATY